MLQWTWGWTYIFKIVIYFHLDVEIQKWDSWIIQVSLSVVSNSFWPMDCSMPGCPILHHLLLFSQTRVHWVGDAIPPSHFPSPPSPSALNLAQHQVVKVLELQTSVFPMNIQGGFPLGLTGLISLLSKGLLKIVFCAGTSAVSASLRPHGLQPTRLLCPWDFPGKSTWVGCHCLLQEIV